LQSVFDTEAVRHGVYPLDARQDRSADAAARPSLTRGRSSFAYDGATTLVPPAAVPELVNRSYRIVAKIQVPAGGADGVLATQGGRFAGWGLLVLEGKPVFVHAVSNRSKHKYRVASPEALAPGKHTIEFAFAYDGGGAGRSGTGVLSVDGKKVAERKLDRTVATRFAPDESFDVGEDTGTPVIEDYAAKMPFRFSGTLDKLTIELR
jgi:arylsulfatase